MSTRRFTAGFKEEVVPQVIERGYPVSEIASRVGVPTHSLYKWVNGQMGKWAVAPGKMEQRGGEYWRPRVGFQGCEHLRRTEEKRDILKAAPHSKK